MAEKTAAAPVAINVPADWDAHRRELDEQQKLLDKKKATLLRCLDPIVAAEYEHRKPLYEWRVECSIFRPAAGKQRATAEKFSELIVAKTEADAWATFCDKIGEYPSRRGMNPIITRLQKRSANDADADN